MSQALVMCFASGLRLFPKVKQKWWFIGLGSVTEQHTLTMNRSLKLDEIECLFVEAQWSHELVVGGREVLCEVVG